MAFEKELQTNQDNASKRLSKVHYQEVNAFRGLDFFNTEHAPFFHGRTKTIGEILDVLRQQASEKKPFVLLLGPEGCGKTSLLRAGILPVLTRVAITERNQCWRVALTRPRDGGTGDPFGTLAAALLEESALPELPDAAIRGGWRNLASELREAPEDAALRIRETLQYLSLQALDHFLDEDEASPAKPERSVQLPCQDKLGRIESEVQLALVVDQLEELFVGGFSPELQQSYIAALGALVKWRAAFVIATLQSDFYTSFQKCCISKDLAVLTQPEIRVRDPDLSQVLTGRFDLHLPRPWEIRDMIRLPAESIGLRFELDPETGRSLDTALLEAATAHPEPLPLLEHLLWQLCRKQSPREDGLLRWSDYRELGEFEGALASHAESVFLALDDNARAAFKSVIRQLVSPGPSEDGVLIRRAVSYRDLVSSPEFSERQKTVAEGAIDRFIKEGLFYAEKTGPNGEVVVSITQACLLRNWPRVRQLLKEDLGILRLRDRLDPNFKLWLSGGRRRHDLLRDRSGIREAKALLRNLHTSLSATQVEYLQKSLRAQNRHRWVRSAAALAAVAGLLAPVIISGIQWLSADIERRKAEQPSGPAGKIAHSADAKGGSFEVDQSQPGNAAQAPRGNAASPASERDALQARLRDTEAEAQQIQNSLALATNQRDALQAQLKDTEAKAQQAQKNAELVASQRDTLQSQLKDAEAKAQQVQKNLELTTSQRDALQGQLKDTEAKAQQVQKDAALATSQRDALQSQLKELAQKNAELPADQRDALQSQLRDAEAKAQQIQKSLELVTTQRDALQNQLKETGAKAQKDVKLVTGERDALQNQLKDTEAKAQQAQKDAALATSQRETLQGQLKDTEAKAQQAQKDAALARGQGDTLLNQLKDTEAKAQQAQKNAELVTSQRGALQAQLQQAQKNANLAISQRVVLEAPLKDTEAKSQQVQKNAELIAARPQAEKGDRSNGELSQKKSAFSANRTESEEIQPPARGLKAEPLASTQPSGSSIQPAQTTAMSSPASVRRPTAAEAPTEGSRRSAEAPVGDQDQDNVALPQPTSTPAAAGELPLAEAQAEKSADDVVDKGAVKQFVLEYIQTVPNNDVSSQERFFAPTVNFYGEGILSPQRVQASNERYRREWPNREWQPQGEAEIIYSANSMQYEVFQPFTWKVSNGIKHAEGKATLYLSIRKNTKGEFHIVRVQYHGR